MIKLHLLLDHDGYLPSQAAFYLAEIYRNRFVDVKLARSRSGQPVTQASRSAPNLRK